MMQDSKKILTGDVIVDKIIKFFFNFPYFITTVLILTIGQLISFNLIPDCGCGDGNERGAQIVFGLLYSLGTWFIGFVVYVISSTFQEFIDNYTDSIYCKYYNAEGRFRSKKRTYYQFKIFLEENPLCERYEK